MRDRSTSIWKGKESPFLLFGLVFLVSACFKLFLLGSRELWLDETYSAFTTQLGFRQLLHFTSGDVHPPLFSVLLWIWVRLVGETQTHLRLFSVLLNIGSMVAMFLLARRILGTRFGVFASMLFAFSPMLFVYSLEVRNYMLFLFVLIGLLSVHWAVAVEHKRSKTLLVAYSLLAAALFYIHYVGVFILLGLFAHRLFCSAFVRERLTDLGLTALFTLLLVAPGIPLALSQYHLKTQMDRELKRSNHDPGALSYGQEVPSHQSSVTLAKSAAVVAGFYPAKSPVLFLLCAIPLAVALSGVAFLWLVKGDPVCRLLGFVSMGMTVGVILLHFGNTRYLLPLVPLLVLAIARVLQYWTASPRWHAFGLAMAACIVCIYCAGFSRQALRPHGRPWQNLVNALQRDYHRGDRVIFSALYAQVPFDYYARHQNFQPEETGFPISIYDWWTRQSFEGWGGPVVKQSDLNQFVSTAPNSKTLWVVLYETYYYDPQEALLQQLRQRGKVTEINLPPDPDAQPSEEDSHLRLVRVSLQ